MDTLMKTLILITGAARSGTSLTAGIIDKCGGFGGIMTGATPYNKSGQFENSHIRENIVKAYLKRLGVDPLCQSPLPSVHDLIPYPELAQMVEETIESEGYTSGAWFYKGAKMCLLWPLFKQAFPGAKWIIVRRDATDIADSCMRTPFMRAFKTQAGWLEWVRIHEKRFEEMKVSGMDVTEIHTADIVAGNLDVIKNFISTTDDLTWNDREVKQFINPKLWKQGKEA